MRTITLELLRHGPTHNQLLSPLTPYLALCENHAAVTVHVPFEHNQFLYRLRALDYKHTEESRVFQLKDTAKVIGDLLATIPGLAAESNKELGVREQLTHLRLIISASELALLPFELALSPNGLPGAGQHLLLQPQLPVCLTREIRRVPNEQLQWPTKHRILFVAAAPPEAGAIPLESHLLTLRRAIDPWVKFFENDEKRQEEIDKHFVFLPDASIEAIEQKCASEKFTHVHILAHGVEQKDNFDTRFYLALHNALDPNKADYISGQRLATALRAYDSKEDKGLARPAVVTLASCNSGGVGSVAGAGASIAHALHEAGIPIVVAGQFPLSFKGSVRLVECLYDGLLWGKDPRWLLYDLRRRLFSQFPDTHDWASLTAYVSLPADFEQQLCNIQIQQAHHSIEAAMNYADAATTKAMVVRTEATKNIKDAMDGTGANKLLLEAKEKITNGRRKLEKLLERFPDKSARIHGLLASTDKRYAEVLFSADTTPDPKVLLELLRSSRDHYWEAFEKDRANSWAVVQYLSLALVIKNFRETLVGTEAIYEKKKERPEKDLNALWSLAFLVSLNDLHNGNQKQAIWAHNNLIELYPLALLLEKTPDVIEEKRVEECALDYAYALLEMEGRHSMDVYSLWKQLTRYNNWYSELADLGKLQDVVGSVVKAFPIGMEEVGV